MREEELRRYFTGEVTGEELASDLRGSVVQLGGLALAVQIADMDGAFQLNRQHLVMLCDAFSQEHLDEESLSAIAFALLASDTFEWDDDITSEILSDWSAPEINFELNKATVNMHREWLVTSTTPPQFQVRMKGGEAGGRLISVRSKIPL